MAPAPRIAVIIPHYEDHARLARCLAALARQVDDDTEVVVVDNASAERPDVSACPDARCVVEPARGAALARNRGVAETTAPVLAFLDCDCVPGEGWLTRVPVAAGRGDLVGGAIAVFDETAPPRSGVEAFETVFAFDNAGYVARKSFSVSANLVTARPVFDAVGGFRPGLSEDLDWCHRAVAMGFRLVHDPDLRVSHPTRQDWPALARKWRRLTRESWGLTGSGPRERLLWAGRALAMLPSVAVHLPLVLLHPGLSGGDRLRAAATLARLRAARCVWMLRQSFGGEL